VTGRRARVAAAVGWAGAVAVAIRGVGGAVRTAESLAWLSAPTPCPKDGGDARAVRFVLVLPLLREQAVIADTLACFEKMATGWPGTVLLVVTTAREDAERARSERRLDALVRALADGVPVTRVASRFAGVLPRVQLRALAGELTGQPYGVCRQRVRSAFAALPSTPQLAAKLCGQARARGVDIRHVHYPRTSGAMAHQVNYAAGQILGPATSNERGRWWIGLYNADSRPHPGTLAAVAVRAADPSTRVVQQSALFTGNVSAMPPGPGGLAVAGAAWLQSRWTLAR